MKTRVATAIVSASALAAALVVLSMPSPAQQDAKGKGGKKAAATGPVVHKPIPRTADGNPT